MTGEVQPPPESTFVMDATKALVFQQRLQCNVTLIHMRVNLRGGKGLKESLLVEDEGSLLASVQPWHRDLQEARRRRQ